MVDNEKQLLMDDHIFEMSFNFLFEIVLSIKPEDLGTLFLLYDC